MNLIYTPFFGFPLCVICMTMGLLFLCTIILAPLGLACFALGFEVLTLKRR